MLLILISISCTQDDRTPVMSGAYLGQEPPGLKPEIFAPGIISTGMSEGSIVFTPDGRECFFNIELVIMHTRFENGQWEEPAVAHFSGKYIDFAPAMHPDGSKFYFMSNRPLNDEADVSEYMNIWVTERSGDGWGEPKPIGPPINGAWEVDGPSLTRDGTLYFSKYVEGIGSKVMRSRLVDGKYQEPEKLPENVNTAETFHTYISPDEKFLIMSVWGREDTLGSTDYYVSFRDENDNWTYAQNLGALVNSDKVQSQPSISADGKYFFFSGFPAPFKSFDKSLTYAEIQEMYDSPGNGNSDIYWVDVRFIEQMNPKTNN